MDWTLYVGIIGAVVGGGIGLLGQRMVLRAQRRKELVHLLAEFVLVSEGFENRARTFVPNSRGMTDEESQYWMNLLNVSLGDVRGRRIYVELVAPRSLRAPVIELAEAVGALYVAIEILNRTRDGMSAVGEAHGKLLQAQRRLITRIQPSVTREPWRTRWPLKYFQKPALAEVE